MDHIDNHQSDVEIRQYLNTNLSFSSPLNYADQFFQETTDQNISTSNIEHEQNENEETSMAIVYKKRVRTKFNQEQLDVLETTFEQHRYPTVDIIDDLVEQLNLPTQKITIWFQNRRARLKKTQQKLDIPPAFEKESQQQQYDSGIHLDEDTSRDSPASLSPSSMPHLPVPPPTSSFMTSPSPYYFSNSPYSFYNSMWPNFGYPFPPSTLQSTVANSTNIPYHLINYNSSEGPPSFLFQDMSNYPHQKEFNGEL